MPTSARLSPVDLALRIQELSAVAFGLAPADLVAEVLGVSVDATGASAAGLFVLDETHARSLGGVPPMDRLLRRDRPLDEFPWDLSALQPRRFIVVHDAAQLPCGDSGCLGDHGVRAAVHLVLCGPDGGSGALHLHFDRPLDRWDDRIGAMLRALGTFALFRLGGTPPSR